MHQADGQVIHGLNVRLLDTIHMDNVDRSQNSRTLTNIFRHMLVRIWIEFQNLDSKTLVRLPPRESVQRWQRFADAVAEFSSRKEDPNTLFK